MKTIELLQASRWPRSFLTMHTAVRGAGMERLLDGRMPITVFAPSDEAFNQLPQGLIYDLLKDIKLLQRLLAYHLVPLALPQSELRILALTSLEEAVNPSRAQSKEQDHFVYVPTYAGHNLRITLTGGLYAQDARLLEPELEADNGIVHPLERVLWPPDLDVNAFFRGRGVQYAQRV